jgi:hypothetical protein
VPTHWNFADEVNGWMPGFPGVFVMPAVLAGIVPAASSLLEWRRERRASLHSGEGRAS